MTLHTAVLTSVFAAVCLYFSVIDVRQRRVPQPALAVAIAVLVAIGLAFALVQRNFAPLLGGVIGAAIAFGITLLLAIISPGAIGGGDVKFMLAPGFVLGTLGLPHVFIGLICGWLLVGAVSMIRLLRAGGSAIRPHRSAPSTELPFVPFASAGALIAIGITDWVLATG